MTSRDHESVPRHWPYTAALAAGLLALAACYAGQSGGGSRPGGRSGAAGERLAPDRWSVSGTGRTPERARNAAFYRGAVLVKAAGYSHVQMVGYRLERYDYSDAPIVTKSGEVAPPAGAPVRTAFVEVAGTNDAAAAPACAPSAEVAAMCRTMPVHEALATLGPLLGRTPDQTAAEVEAARRAQTARPRGG